jgi:hypothetical protein
LREAGVSQSTQKEHKKQNQRTHFLPPGFLDTEFTKSCKMWNYHSSLTTPTLIKLFSINAGFSQNQLLPMSKDLEILFAVIIDIGWKSGFWICGNLEKKNSSQSYFGIGNFLSTFSLLVKPKI